MTARAARRALLAALASVLVSWHVAFVAPPSFVVGTAAFGFGGLAALGAVYAGLALLAAPR